MKEKIDALKETFLRNGRIVIITWWSWENLYLQCPWRFKYRRTGLLAILCCISTCVISKTFAIYLLLPMLLYLPG